MNSKSIYYDSSWRYNRCHECGLKLAYGPQEENCPHRWVDNGRRFDERRRETGPDYALCYSNSLIDNLKIHLEKHPIPGVPERSEVEPSNLTASEYEEFCRKRGEGRTFPSSALKQMPVAFPKEFEKHLKRSKCQCDWTLIQREGCQCGGD